MHSKAQLSKFGKNGSKEHLYGSHMICKWQDTFLQQLAYIAMGWVFKDQTEFEIIVGKRTMKLTLFFFHFVLYFLVN